MSAPRTMEPPEIMEGMIYYTRSGPVRVLQIGDGKVRFEKHIGCGRIQGTLPLLVFQQQATSWHADPLSDQYRSEFQDCSRAIQRHKLLRALYQGLIGLGVYWVGALMFWYRGLEWWWYWPLRMAWTILLDLRSDWSPIA
jgi:hypothetical protein